MNINPANIASGASLPPQTAAETPTQTPPSAQQVKSETEMNLVKTVVTDPQEEAAAKTETKAAEAKGDAAQAKATDGKTETRAAENNRPAPTAASQVEVTTKDVLLDKLAELKKVLDTRANIISSLPENIKEAVRDILKQGAVTENNLPEGLTNLLKSQNLTGKQLVALANVLDDAARILGDKQAAAQLTQLLAKLFPGEDPSLLNQQKLAEILTKLNSQEMTPKQLTQTLQTLLGEVLSQNPSLANNARQLVQLLSNQNQSTPLPPELAKLAETIKQPDLNILWTLTQNAAGNKNLTPAQQQLLELAAQFLKGQQGQNPNQALNQNQASVQTPNQAMPQVPGQAASQILNQVPGQTIPQVPNQTPALNQLPNQVLNQILQQVLNQNQVPGQAGTQNPAQVLIQNPNTAPNPNAMPTLPLDANQVLNQSTQVSAQNLASAPGQIQFQETLKQILPQILTPENLKLLEQGTFLKQLAAQNASQNAPPLLAQMAKEANVPELLQLWNLHQTLTMGGKNVNPLLLARAEQNLNQLAANLLSGNISLSAAKNNLDILLNSFQGFGQFGAEEENLTRSLLKQTLTSLPPQIQQAALKHNLPELPRAWLLTKLAALEANIKEQAAAEIKLTANNVRVLSTLMQRSAVTPSIEHQSGNTVLSFSTPLYFGEGQAYPANIHIYQEYAEGGTAAAGRKRKKNETWVRITLDTQNIGNVDTFFRLYDQDKLDVRVRFQEAQTAAEFGEFLPEIRRAMQDSPLELTDLSVRSNI
ncbi:MAG: hypothetical protein LBR56_05845 [Sporomusaceae bacterium]|nr:hypothetical protein [Sporomusaceae bacterium]